MKPNPEIPIPRPLFDKNEIGAVAQVIRSGWVTQGPKMASGGVAAGIELTS